MLQFKMMKRYSLHTKIKNEMKLKNEMITKVMQVKGSKVKGHTLLKRNPKGRLQQDLCKTKELQ